MSDEESLRNVCSWLQRRGGVRDDLIEAVLALAGERGFSELTLGAVCERAGTDYYGFHRQFETLEEAFAEGYQQLAEALCEDLLAAGREGADWRSGFRAALRTFLAWVATYPQYARVILTEYRLAGSAAWAEHDLVTGRLAHATNLARSDPGEIQAPEIFAAVLLGSIEFTVAARVGRGEVTEVPALERSLAYLAVSVFFGAEVAEGELGEGD